MTTLTPIHICSLDAAKELELSLYDGVITIEDSNVRDPLRIYSDHPKQLILCFDDINEPIDEYIVPQESHIKRAIKFSNNIVGGSLLIHCHAGISRSSAIALAIIANNDGIGNEIKSIKTLEYINPNCRPNKSIVRLTDDLLKRNNMLYKNVFRVLGYN
tara:strand:+ start:7572 stop:8048 length:477 start_codon:yes stop_codon:yes gene_type:complete